MAEGDFSEDNVQPPLGPSPGFKRASELYAQYLSEEGSWATQVRGTINASLAAVPPKVLWHYCPLSSMEGIVRSGKFFMSSLMTMNDYKEGRWLRERISERVKTNSRQFLNLLDATKIKFKLDPFILSLSERDDLLSQWRAYASGGKGVALGLESSRLQVPMFKAEREQMSGQTVLANVIYDEEVQNSVIDRIVSIIDSLVRELDGLDCEDNSHPFVPLSAYMNLYLHYIEPIFKNPAFVEESEWRIIFFPASNVLNTWNNQISKIELSDNNESSSIRFRFRDDDIVPHFLFPTKFSLYDMISHVMLGPLCKMQQIPLTLFLKSFGISSFSIVRSKASLR